MPGTLSQNLASSPHKSPNKVAHALAARGEEARTWWRGSETSARARHWTWNNGATDKENAPPSPAEQADIRARYNYADEASGGPSELYIKVRRC